MAEVTKEDLNQAGYKYYAFISYSRRDARAASYFQRKMEHFRIPTKYVSHDRLPLNRKFAKPVFRDRRDLESRGTSFTTDIREAIERSRFLIVICSPESAKSLWVEREILHFLKTHGQDESLIVPVILSGDAGSGDPTTECLPMPLRTEGVCRRNLPSMIPDGGDPLDNGWENGVVQALSYLLDVDRGCIKASVDAERVRQMKIYSAIGIVCTFVFAGLAFWAVRAKHEAEVARERTRNILSNFTGFNSTLGGKGTSFTLASIEEYWKRSADQDQLMRQSIESFRVELAEEVGAAEIMDEEIADSNPRFALHGLAEKSDKERLQLAQKLWEECKADESEEIYLAFTNGESACRSEICFELLKNHYANEGYAVRKLYGELGTALLGDKGARRKGARLLSKLRMANLAREERQRGDARSYLRQSVVQFYEMVKELGNVSVHTPLDYLGLDDMSSFLATAKGERHKAWFRWRRYMSDRSRLIKKVNSVCHTCAELAALELMEQFYAEYKEPDPIARLTVDVEYHLPYACSESVRPCLLEIYLWAAKEDIDMLKAFCREMSDHLKTKGKQDVATRVANFTGEIMYLGKPISL